MAQCCRGPDVQEGLGERSRAVGNVVCAPLGASPGVARRDVWERALGRLPEAAPAGRWARDDAKLDALVDEIELRAEVDLAKRQQG